MTLEFPFAIITLNDYINIERTNKYKAASVKRKFTNKIKMFTLSQTRQKIEGLHDVEIDWYKPHKRHDADNVFAGVKFLLDGIAASGFIKSDNRKNIRNISHRIHTGKDRIVIKFIKV